MSNSHHYLHGTWLSVEWMDGQMHKLKHCTNQHDNGQDPVMHFPKGHPSDNGKLESKPDEVKSYGHFLPNYGPFISNKDLSAYRGFHHLQAGRSGDTLVQTEQDPCAT